MLHNHELKQMIDELGFVDALSNVDIEQVNDMTTRIILRTILTSMDILAQRLRMTPEELAAENQ